MSSAQTDRMGFTDKQKKLLEERRCFKCERKMTIIDKSSGSLSGNVGFRPNETKTFYIPLHASMWPGASSVGEGGVRRFKVRVIYENNTKKVSSRSYNVEIRP